MGRDPETPSWFDAFAPDEGEIGIICLITSLTADSTFLEGALRAFTAAGPGARRADGRLAMTLLADRHQPELPAVPGLYQPFARTEAWAPAQLQHAKVGLLAFGPAAHGPPTTIRLLVSTGNWTTQTMCGSIDLLWRCDVGQHRKGQPQLAQEAADIAAALDFLVELQRRYILPHPVDEALGRLATQVQDLIAPHRRADRPRPRFLATLGTTTEVATTVPGWGKGSMGAQVISRFQAGTPRRNMIICGSGFFEQARDGEAEPVILRSLVSTLQQDGVLARNLDDQSKYLVANPGTAGAVAAWARSGEAAAAGWSLPRPLHPATKAATGFHAKFIMLGNQRDRITAGQLYLGSGNLSIQGFMKGSLGLDAHLVGNVEAGVVLEVPAIEGADLGEALGFDHEEDATADDFPETAADEAADIASPDLRPVPPIVAAIWHDDQRRLSVVWSPGVRTPCSLRIGCLTMSFDSSADAVALPADQVVPTRIEILDSTGAVWTVPVFRSDGAFCRGSGDHYGLSDALDRLLDFPLDGADEHDGDGDDGVAAPPASGLLDEDVAIDRRRHPIHLAMRLVETIAERNQTVLEPGFPDWVVHLQRVLLEELASDSVDALRSLGINVLGPLISQPGFAPPFTNDRYQELMGTVVARWGMAEFPGFDELTVEAGA